MNTEQQRISDPSWKIWGPYVSNREWGLVREDYSADGDAWNYTNHDSAEAKTYRWEKKAFAAFVTKSKNWFFRSDFGTGKTKW